MADTQQPYDRSLFDGLTEDSQLEFKNVMNSVGQTYIVSGARLGRYQVIEEIDRGGMAVVYKACQLDLDRFVALKVLPANITINKNFVDRFWAEAHAIAKLHHPNIVDIYEVAVEENIHYLAMEYIAGKNLYYFLNNEKPKLIVVIDIIRQLAEALSYAHEQKILHRDLKLNNVLMKNNNTPVLIDFGLAKMIENTDVVNLTIPGEIVGSPAYMAPERLLGKAVDVRSDICSLG
ncbi:MAG: serine/threonine protein kinase, partial [Chitinivibrionales bacterium]|nr:serine/threonine protein kinase [Chitinivibrionales bacterium]